MTKKWIKNKILLYFNYQHPRLASGLSHIIICSLKEIKMKQKIIDPGCCDTTQYQHNNMTNDLILQKWPKRVSYQRWYGHHMLIALLPLWDNFSPVYILPAFTEAPAADRLLAAMLFTQTPSSCSSSTPAWLTITHSLDHRTLYFDMKREWMDVTFKYS